MTSARRSLLPYVLLAVFVPVALVLGLWLGGHPSSLPGPLRDLFVDPSIRTVDEAFSTIQDDYYRSVPREKLADQAVKGAIAGLNDRFSGYFDPAEYRRFQESTAGQFSGVGLSVEGGKQGLKVTRGVRGAPAAKAGLRAGDTIVAVNGAPLAGKSVQASTALIKGQEGTFVRLTYERGGRRKTVRVQRQQIDVPAVESKLVTFRGQKVGVDALGGFTSGAHGELRRAIDRQLKAGAQGIVLDLRGNGGGLLDEAVLISSIFVPNGTVVSTDGRSRDRQVYRATGGAIKRSIPVVVLVDGGSASASEIVTAALQDRGRAKVVGARTFGKGVFQEIEALGNGGALDITVGEYFTPNGRNLGGGGVKRGSGVKPDIPAADNPDTAPDEALQQALKTLAAERQQ
jgi:carboxyl-terminal processing protease